MSGGTAEASGLLCRVMSVGCAACVHRVCGQETIRSGVTAPGIARFSLGPKPSRQMRCYFDAVLARCGVFSAGQKPQSRFLLEPQGRALACPFDGNVSQLREALAGH